MNAINMLKKDHRILEKLLKLINSTTERSIKMREKLFEDLTKEIQNHTKIEEKIFYPTLKRYAQAKEIVLEAYEEHHYVDTMIADIKKLDYDEENWKAKFVVLKENLKHHIQEEETCLFPIAQKVLANDELNILGDDMQKLKENLNSGIITSVISSLMASPPNFINSNSEKKQLQKKAATAGKKKMAASKIGRKKAAAASKRPAIKHQKTKTSRTGYKKLVKHAKTTHKPRAAIHP